MRNKNSSHYQRSSQNHQNHQQQHSRRPSSSSSSSTSENYNYHHGRSSGFNAHPTTHAHHAMRLPLLNKAPQRELTPLLREESSLSDTGSMDEYDRDVDYFGLQLFAYRLIYVIQGAFIGLLGPSLAYFSQLALNESGLSSPVSSFGPIFAAHGGAALVMSFVSELVLNFAIEMELMKYFIVGLLCCSGVWYACLTPVAAATGNVGVCIYFIAKGFWVALLNISLNRCSLWIAGDQVEYGRSLVTSMNIAYGLGTVLGATGALILGLLSWELKYAFYVLAIALVIPAGIIGVTKSPKPLSGRDAHQAILAFEDPTRRVPTVPSPIVGGVFLHVKHYGGSANCNPDTYDPLNNLIILLVTLMSTLLFGIQLGLCAFLFDYIGTVFSSGSSSASDSSSTADNELYQWNCALMIAFWAALWLSYCFFSKFMFHAFNLYSIFHLSLVCMCSSFGILFGIETGTVTFVICILLFAFALAPLFTLNIHCLTRVINEQLIRRVSSLIVFGCGMGEVFIPVLMGFFMSGQSGQMYGSVAVSYITFILSIALVVVSGMLLRMVKKKLVELAEKDPEILITAELSVLNSRSHTPGKTMNNSRY